MVLITLFIVISLVYLYQTSYTQIPTLNKYAFVLMVCYIVIYLNMPQMEGYAFVHKYTYVFAYYPLVSYFIILFPHCVLIPTKDFFPQLSDHLAIKATRIIAWVGFLLMFTLLVGVNFFYQSNI